MISSNFYMALSFSVTVFEEAFRNKIKRLYIYSFIDFSIRIVVLIIHFTTLIFKINISNINLITIVLFIVNVLIEVILVYMVKDMKQDEMEIEQSDINKFLKDFEAKRLDYCAVGTDLKEEITNIVKTLKISGRSTIVIIILIIVMFISRFIYQNFVQLLFIPLVLLVSLLYILFKLSHQINSIVYSNDEECRKRNLIDTITFFIGYVILFGAEAIFYDQTGYFNVSIRVLAILFSLPMFNTKYIVKKKFEAVYQKYVASSNI